MTEKTNPNFVLPSESEETSAEGSAADHFKKATRYARDSQHLPVVTAGMVPETDDQPNTGIKKIAPESTVAGHAQKAIEILERGKRRADGEDVDSTQEVQISEELKKLASEQAATRAATAAAIRPAEEPKKGGLLDSITKIFDRGKKGTK